MVSIQILPIVNILLFLTLMKFSTVENLFKYELASNWQTIVNCDGMNAKIYIIDKIMKLDGDGIIPLKSQKIDRIGIPEKIISGTHKTGYRKTIKKFLK